MYEQLENNKRLERPDNCPRDWYALMAGCWAWDDQERMKFSELYYSLKVLQDRMLKEKVSKKQYKWTVFALSSADKISIFANWKTGNTS